MNIIAYTFEAVRTTFLELFHTPKSPMETFTPRERTRQQHEQNLLKTTLENGLKPFWLKPILFKAFLLTRVDLFVLVVLDLLSFVDLW